MTITGGHLVMWCDVVDCPNHVAGTADRTDPRQREQAMADGWVTVAPEPATATLDRLADPHVYGFYRSRDYCPQHVDALSQ